MLQSEKMPPDTERNLMEMLIKKCRSVFDIALSYWSLVAVMGNELYSISLWRGHTPEKSDLYMIYNHTQKWEKWKSATWEY